MTFEPVRAAEDLDSLDPEEIFWVARGRHEPRRS